MRISEVKMPMVEVEHLGIMYQFLYQNGTVSKLRELSFDGVWRRQRLSKEVYLRMVRMVYAVGHDREARARKNSAQLEFQFQYKEEL